MLRLRVNGPAAASAGPDGQREEDAAGVRLSYTSVTITMIFSKYLLASLLVIFNLL
jgi:hypothetical protein